MAWVWWARGGKITLRLTAGSVAPLHAVRLYPRDAGPDPGLRHQPGRREGPGRLPLLQRRDVHEDAVPARRARHHVHLRPRPEGHVPAAAERTPR